jgi:hypothetical protein
VHRIAAVVFASLGVAVWLGWAALMAPLSLRHPARLVRATIAAMKYLHTMVRVTDIEASLRFYRDALGLEL